MSSTKRKSIAGSASVHSEQHESRTVVDLFLTIDGEAVGCGCHGSFEIAHCGIRGLLIARKNEF